MKIDCFGATYRAKSDSRLEFIDRAPQAVGGKSRKANDHKAYYPGPVPLRVQVTGDRRSGRAAGSEPSGLRLDAVE